MSLPNLPKAYATLALALAFASGVVLTLGLEDRHSGLDHFREWCKPPSATGNQRSLIESKEQLSYHGLVSPHCTPRLVYGVQGTIGKTHLVELKSLSQATGRTILAKAELLNGAGGSPKDRVALSIIRAAEAAGQLVPGRGDCIYEGTVGSTGISLAILARALGYKAHIFMPDDQAVEKSDLLVALGASVDRVKLAPITDPNHFVNLARAAAKLHASRKKDGSFGFFADQFENPANWKAHFETTGPEIYSQTGRDIDAFVCGAGTGGTISGVAKFLKEVAFPQPSRPLPCHGTGAGPKVVLADPQGSGLYHKIKHGVMFSPTEKEGTRRRQQVDSIVEGVGITRLTHNFDVGRELIDDAVRVTDEQAMRMAKWLVEHDGVFCGSSTAVNCVGAVVTAMTLPPGSVVVTLLCDSGNRHLSKFWRLVAEIDEQNDEDLFTAVAILGTDT